MFLRISRSQRALLLAATSVAALSGFASTPALGACDTWNGGSGNWNNGSDWSGGTPTSGEDVCILNGGTVTLNVSATIGDLTIGSTNELNFNLGTTLAVDGTSISNANLMLMNAGSGNNTFLNIQNNVDLTGAGALDLVQVGGSGANFIQQSGGSFTLTNDSTIEGTGIIGNGGLTLVNDLGAIVDANQSAGTLTLNGSGGVTNTGTLEATGGGILQISTGVTNTNGLIESGGSGSTVDVSSTILNGTLTTTSNGAMQTSGSATLNGVTLSGGSTYLGGFGSTTNFLNTITNNGTFTLSAGSGNNAFVNIESNVVLTGSGSLDLLSLGGSGASIIEQSGGSFTLTNESTIAGTGTIGNGGLSLANDAGATVDANQSGLTLTLNGTGGIINTGTLEATGGGILQISTGVTNTNGLIESGGSGSTVDVSSTILNGTLTTQSNGVMQTVGSATLNGVTLSSGSAYLGDLGTTTNFFSTITNNGTFTFNGGSGNNSLVNIDNNVDLIGTGALVLNQEGGAGAAIIQQSGGGFTLTNNSTIEGAGTIGNGGLTVVNNDLIDANQSSGTLTLDGTGGVTNTDLLEATNGGTLQILTTDVTNSGANITANGGAVDVQGSTIVGGTLNTLNGGTMQTVGSATLNGVTLSGGSAYLGGLNTTTNFFNTITNNGTFTFNGGSGSNTFVNIDNNVDLTGTGALVLDQVGGTGNAIIEQSGGGFTLTNDSTIEGAGIIGNGGLTLLNHSLVNANQSGGILYLDGTGGVTNTDLLEATNGGTLQILTTDVTNSGANITANGGAVNVQGSTIVGGTLNTLNGGTMQTVGSATLNGVTLSGGSAYLGGLNTTTNFFNTITNNGTFTFNGGSGSNTFVNIDNNVDLTGTGALVLDQVGGTGNAIIEQSGGGFTLTNDSTIEGAGIIGNGGLTLLNHSLVNANQSGGILYLDGTGGVTNTDLLEATNGGTLQILTTDVTNSGANITANGGAVNVQGSTIVGGTLNTLNGGTMQTVVSATLNGVTLSGGSAYLGGLNTTTNFFNTITNNGTFTFNGGSGNNTFVNIDNNVDLTGTGALVLDQVGGTGNAVIEQSGGGFTLTNDSTIEGAGIIGNGGLTLLNNDLISANQSGGTLFLNGSGAITNNGTFEVSAGSVMHVLNGAFTNWNSGTHTLTGGTYDIYGSLASPGTMQINELGSTGGEIVNNDATIYLNGVNSNLLDANGLDALFNFDNNGGGGSFTITNGRNFASPDDFANAGQVTVGASSTFSAGAAGLDNYNQSAGNTQVDGTLRAANTNVNGGQLEGTGTVVGDLFNYGTVKPGDLNPAESPGTLTVQGNFTQESTGTIQIDIAGTGAGQYGQLDIVGNTRNTVLDGTLALALLGSFHFATGHSYFDIINSDPFSGDFIHFTLDGVGCSGGHDVWTCGSVMLTEEFCGLGSTAGDCLQVGPLDELWLDANVPQNQTVPEPMSLLLVGSGLAAAAALRRRRAKPAGG